GGEEAVEVGGGPGELVATGYLDPPGEVGGLGDVVDGVGEPVDGGQGSPGHQPAHDHRQHDTAEGHRTEHERQDLQVPLELVELETQLERGAVAEVERQHPDLAV